MVRNFGPGCVNSLTSRAYTPWANGGNTQPRPTIQQSLAKKYEENLFFLQVNKSLVTEAAAVTTRDIFRRPQPSTVPQIRLVLPPVPLKTVLVLDVSQVITSMLCI